MKRLKYTPYLSKPIQKEKKRPYIEGKSLKSRQNTQIYSINITT